MNTVCKSFAYISEKRSDYHIQKSKFLDINLNYMEYQRSIDIAHVNNIIK